MTLQARGRVTAEALAAEFEVSLRTIYRDVDELSASGVPVIADRGPGGGFQLREGYRTHLTGLTPQEATTVLLAGLPGPAADLGLTDALMSAERKILAALPAQQSARALDVRQRVLLDPLDWYRRIERPRHLAAVAEALWSHARVSVQYESWTANTMQTLEPLGLVIKAGVWYLVARSRSRIRTYRVSRIQTCRVLPGTFEVPADFQLATHWAAELARFEQSLKRELATIAVGPRALSRVERLGADAAETIRAAAVDRRGWRTATIPIESTDHAAMELLGFGRNVRVISPPALRRTMGKLANAVRRLYSAR